MRPQMPCQFTLMRLWTGALGTVTLAAAIAIALAPLLPASAQETGSNAKAVKVVAPALLEIPTSGARAKLALYVSADWSTPQPAVTRAVLIFHGLLRNADVYYESAVAARALGGVEPSTTLLIAPQFLSPDDATAHHLSTDTLVWDRDSWSGGGDAVAPAPLSSFAAIDAILRRLSDRALFPDLKTVVVAGHSGGGQVVQRYAAVGQGEQALTAQGVHVRYVVANPSSYVYFTAQRPDAQGALAPFAGAAACPGFNDWKYGFAAGVPAYVNQPMQAYEASYAARDVVYLLGTLDIDPNHPVLDKTCMGKAQGPYRYARGHGYFAAMQARLGKSFTHHLHDVPGVGHDGGKMLGAACGLNALFDTPGCP